MSWIHCRVIHIGDFSYSVYCSFLNYLYSGNVDFTNIDFVDLLELADCYCEPLLKSVCQYYIRQEAEVDDIATLYELALRYEARVSEKIIKFSVRFARFRGCCPILGFGVLLHKSWLG